MFSYLDSSIDIVYQSYLKSYDKNNNFLIYPNQGKQTIPIHKKEVYQFIFLKQA